MRNGLGATPELEYKSFFSLLGQLGASSEKQMAQITTHKQQRKLPLKQARKQAKRLTFRWAVLGLVCSAVWPAYASNAGSTVANDLDVKVSSPLGDVRAKSDQELTELTAQWGQLSPAERRLLLGEVRTRMQRNRAAAAQRRLANAPRVKVTRRYGRIIRQPDGSVVVQTRVVRPGGSASHGRITFGFGFERRGKQQVESTQAAADSAQNPD